MREIEQRADMAQAATRDILLRLGRLVNLNDQKAPGRHLRLTGSRSGFLRY